MQDFIILTTHAFNGVSGEISRQRFPVSKSLQSWSMFWMGDGPVTGRFMAHFKALDLGRYQTKFSVKICQDDTAKDYMDG
ncbi:hypothetical protein CEXT_544891 [Caerostris extrusa]|uniref:Uncharacterized protein n=1 Tax=Caerostris extrusa TaxID=172846 RepID=A0AAV4N3Q5_CAEEX|nr:hypothetical protein CEXT_544891 [Caerostris extrusa]